MPIYFLTMAAVVLLGLAEGILIGLAWRRCWRCGG